MKTRVFKILKILAVSVLLLAVILFILSIYLGIKKANERKPIKDVERNLTITLTGDSENGKMSFFKTYYDMDTSQLSFYQDKQDALNDFSYITNTEKQYHVNELVFVKEIMFDDAERLFYILPRPENGSYLLCIYDLIIKDGMYSQLVEYDSRCVNFFDYEFIYEFDDAVVEGIYTDFCPIIKENGDRVYCGFWDNKKDIDSLSILGQAVNDITELKYDDGSVYYMWTATINDYDEKIMEVEQPFTSRKFIKAFEIKY